MAEYLPSKLETQDLIPNTDSRGKEEERDGKEDKEEVRWEKYTIPVCYCAAGYLQKIKIVCALSKPKGMTLRIFTKKKEHVLRAVESACDDNSQSVEAWDPEFSLQSEASETLSQNEQISM